MKRFISAVFAIPFIVIAGTALAGYDIHNKNIIRDITTMAISDVGTTDYLQVFHVTDTQYGFGTAEKIPLTYTTPYVATLTAASALASTDCGKTYLLSSATEFATTLPAPVSGCKLKFIVAAAPSGASYTVITDSSSNIILGQMVSTEDAAGSGDFETSGADTISFVDGKAVVGDWMECITGGTKWYCTGAASVQDGITLTTAS